MPSKTNSPTIFPGSDLSTFKSFSCLNDRLVVSLDCALIKEFLIIARMSGSGGQTTDAPVLRILSLGALRVVSILNKT